MLKAQENPRPAVEARLQLHDVSVFPLSDGLPEVLVAAEDGVLGVADTPRGDRPGVDGAVYHSGSLCGGMHQTTGTVRPC